MTNRKKMVGKICKLQQLLKEVAEELNDTPLAPITGKQTNAINAALRSLDFDNRYLEGDLLRTAFGVELDAVGIHTRGNQ